MGVYIKDMNMPDECYCCPCSQPVAGGLQGRCNLLWRDFSANPHSRYQDCPLVEVKEPLERIDRSTKIIMWLLKRYYERLEETFEEELKQVDEILKPVRLMDLIYAEQCKVMPKPLYEYGFGDAESEE